MARSTKGKVRVGLCRAQDQLDQLGTKNEIFIRRTQHVGVGVGVCTKYMTCKHRKHLVTMDPYYVVCSMDVLGERGRIRGR